MHHDLDLTERGRRYARAFESTPSNFGAGGPFVRPAGVEPPAWRSALAKRLETLLDMQMAMIAALDALDGDPDLEPSIGYGSYGSQDLEGDTSDDEPMIGWSEGQSLRGDFFVHEYAEDEKELVNEDGGDVQDEPHDLDTDLEWSLGWGFDGMHQGPAYLAHGQRDNDCEADTVQVLGLAHAEARP